MKKQLTITSADGSERKIITNFKYLNVFDGNGNIKSFNLQRVKIIMSNGFDKIRQEKGMELIIDETNIGGRFNYHEITKFLNELIEETEKEERTSWIEWLKFWK